MHTPRPDLLIIIDKESITPYILFDPNFWSKIWHHMCFRQLIARSVHKDIRLTDQLIEIEGSPRGASPTIAISSE